MKKIKKLHRWIEDEIYGQSFHLFVNYKTEEIKQVLETKYDMTIKDINMLGADWITGSCIRLQIETQGVFVIRLNLNNAKNKEYIPNIISHEICHHVYEGLGSIGMIVSEDSEEVYAYYTGYITQKIYKVLKTINL